MQAGFARSRGGEQRCVLLVGDPGVGKTRLAAEFLARAGSRVLTLSARAYPLGGTASFGLWAEALEGHLRTLPPEEVVSICGGFLDDLASLLRSVAACICILDSISPLELLLGVGEGIDAGGYMASHQLEIAGSGETYFRSGRFSSQEMVAYLDHSVSASTRDGRFPLARVICEVPWSPSDSLQEEELFRLECELTRFADRYPQAILCLYDISHFGGGIVLEVLKTHHGMLFGDLVFEAPP